jgi:bifunctional UDP-N-acetylglucosamine pyrophosphorylase/glucosamine-1-phosphate N-acetyltransferase
MDKQDAYDRSVEEAAAVRRRVAELARSGVTVHDPDRVWVEGTVTVEAGAVLWGGAVLRGATSVAAGAEIQTGVLLLDTSVGEGAVVKPYSVCEGATIGARVAVGPMAHLRPGAVIREEAKVGNFVEVKNATIGADARVGHLTYIGDAEVGAGANVGAGTITCNFDGFGKYRTHIGDRAFIGSNTALVAPVTVGNGAIVGAGSTITRDVPPDALAVVRGESVVREGLAPRLNEVHRQRAAGRRDG